MAELAEFVRRGAGRISPRILKNVYKALPMLKIEFAQIDAPSFPHLEQQLQFLANLVEDFADAIRLRREPLCSGAEGRRSLVAARAIYESARTGRVVDVMS